MSYVENSSIVSTYIILQITEICLYNIFDKLQLLTCGLLGEFQKLWKEAISIVMTVCPSAWNNSVPTGRIFMIYEIWVFFKNLSMEFKFY
jgi:hypothetical protein